MQIGAKLQSLYVLVQIMLYYFKTYFSNQIIRSDVFVQRQIAKHKVNLHEFFSVPLSQLDRNAPHAARSQMLVLYAGSLKSN